MGEDSGRSTTIGFLRRGSGTSLRNQSNEEKPNQCSNKPVNTTKINPAKARGADNKEKPRFLRESFHPSGSKAAFASSSKAPVRKYHDEKLRCPLLAEVNNAESSNRRAEVNHPRSSKKVVEENGQSYAQQTEPEKSSFTSTTGGGQPADLDPEVLDSSISSGISPCAIDSIVRNTALRTASRRQKDKEEFNLGRPQTASASVCQPTVPRNSTAGVKSSNGVDAAVQRRGLKNLGCTSISDILPSGCTPSNSVNNKRAEVMRKRTSGGESSSRLRGVSGQSSSGHSPSMYPSTTGSRVRAAEQSASQQAIRTSSRIIRDSADSVNTRRPSNQHATMRMPDEREDGVFPLRDTITRFRQPDWAQFALDEVSSQRSTMPFSLELPHAIYSANRQGSINRASRSRMSSHLEESPPHTFHGFLGERDGYRRINIDGIQEVLVTLDRIEQDDELTYEQLLVLEANLFLSSLGLHDQHRDMRMDIDNMSYEELLQLEERIGSVTTALSEEQFAKCVNRNVYEPANSELELNRAAVDDVKCSVCQEEYIEGDEVGKMQCEHQYHVSCIQEWLRQKNWCPICKASAIPLEMDKGDT